jgi:hypothetical protein
VRARALAGFSFGAEHDIASRRFVSGPSARLLEQGAGNPAQSIRLQRRGSLLSAGTRHSPEALSWWPLLVLFLPRGGVSFGRPLAELAICLCCRYFSGHAIRLEKEVYQAPVLARSILRSRAHRGKARRASRRVHQMQPGVYYLHRLIEKHGRKGNMMSGRSCSTAIARGATHIARTNVATWYAAICRRCSS